MLKRGRGTWRERARTWESLGQEESEGKLVMEGDRMFKSLTLDKVIFHFYENLSRHIDKNSETVFWQRRNRTSALEYERVGACMSLTQRGLKHDCFRSSFERCS